MSEHKFELLGDADSHPGLGLLASAQAAATVSGGWSNSAVGPTVYSKGDWYLGSNIPSLSVVPSNAVITYVTWTWDSSERPVGMLVYLCVSKNTCLDVSRYQSFGTTAFNGLSASTSFFFAFAVPGSGSIHPIPHGKTNTINVSWAAN